MKRLLTLSGIGVLLVLSTCSDRSSISRRAGGSAQGGMGASDAGLNFGTGGSDGALSFNDVTILNYAQNCTDQGVPPANCGNGALTPDEACDDGNREPGDGCASNCLCVDPGYSCNPPGSPCRPIARCGDGVVAFLEPCDDGNRDGGDGCSAICKIEIGYKCTGSPSTCSPTTCGDGVKEGAESCDDGNSLPFDGCSSVCQTEPNCTSDGCTSECGDGLVIDEACDDGNRIDGDGCSSSCEIEPGFLCSQDLSCEQRDGKCVLRVPAIFRDFNQSHSDFEVQCRSGVKDITEPTLSAQGKPVLANNSGACIASASSFAEWYTDTSNNATIVGDIVLFDNGNGGFVNRWGPNGEQWAGTPIYTNLRWCGNTSTNCLPSPGAPNWFNGCGFDPATEQCWTSSWPPGCCGSCSCAGSVTDQLFDGNPVFFPIDGLPGALADTRYEAIIANVYGYPSWPWEKEVYAMPAWPYPQITNGANLQHNFHFTTEVKYWFRYDAAKSATLDFTGDDDVWVFLNGTLAVDLGGVHIPENGSVSVNSTTASSFGLQDGKVYEIAVFHAERKLDGSSFRLTLEGFQTAHSDCVPQCGDGIVSLGEECDDGVNDGGYGECNPGCLLGGYCGDGILQENEDCDDGNVFDGDSCGSACRILIR